MARYSRRLPAARREWLVPGLLNTELTQRARQVSDASEWNLPLGSQDTGDGGTKILANGLVRPQQFRDPTGPPGSAAVSHPLGPYTIERIVGSIITSTDNTELVVTIQTTIFGVFDTGNPYEASGTTPSFDRLRTQEGVMHCAVSMCTADSSGPATENVRVDIRTKRIVVPGKSFYLINHANNTGNGTAYTWPVIKCLVRYA